MLNPRYLGPTDFAKGEWAGIELDAGVGKNDGTVDGKRYFECAANFGLFAPIHKVSLNCQDYIFFEKITFFCKE